MEETMANGLEAKDKVIIASSIGGATAAGAVGTIAAAVIKNRDEWR
jgi:ABC-type xylose transport system permease subunit